jgi:hypothetical protein
MMIQLNDLLEKSGLAPHEVMVMRHRPTEPKLHRALPWLAQDQPEVYNAYQSQHGPRVEQSLAKRKYLASFIGWKPGRALFVGLYENRGSRRISRRQFLGMPGNQALLDYGTRGPADGHDPLWFELQLRDELSSWKGRLELEWTGIDRSWWRLAEKNEFPVTAIHGENQLARDMPDWQELVLSWQELKALPGSWASRLAEWRGIYYIFDTAEHLGYVGAAYGNENVLGRWKNYARSGDGGNRRLIGRDPNYFEFSILERVSPDMGAEAVQALEAQWEKRLHTRYPFGLNDN